MEDYLQQVEAAVEAQLYFLAITGALTVPDICAASEADDGRTSGALFIAWCDQWLTPLYTRTIRGETTVLLPGDDVWKLRCAFLHQGRLQDERLTHDRVVFVEPIRGWRVHRNLERGRALQLGVLEFVADVVEVARAWRRAKAGDETVERNLARFVQRHPDGAFGYGLPIIG